MVGHEGGAHTEEVVEMMGVVLTEQEVLLLEERLVPSEVSVERAGGGFLPSGVPSKELVLKVGSAYLEVVDGAREVEVVLTEEECWVLRERVRQADGIGSHGYVGRGLKAKIYRMLMEFDARKRLGEVKVVGVEEPKKSWEEVRDALARAEREGSKG